jgi:hypothetical protein
VFPVRYKFNLGWFLYRRRDVFPVRYELNVWQQTEYVLAIKMNGLSNNSWLHHHTKLSLPKHGLNYPTR